MVKTYQITLSRLWPNACIYHPSCSHYMLHAVTTRGLILGGLLGAWRILRCHPFATGGYDPPPGYETILAEESDAMRRQNTENTREKDPSRENE